MGIETNFYVGVYIEAIINPRTRKGTTETYYPTFYELVPNEYEDCLTDATVEPLYNNEKRFFISNCDIGREYCDKPLEITEELIEKNISEFKNEFGNIINILEKEVKLLEIKFGTLIWYG